MLSLLKAMETHNAGSSLETSRKGHKKSKTSNLQARLCPNFNIRDTLKAEKDSTCTKTYLQNHNQEGLNPKTMDFATLVTLLQPTFIVEYLHKILNFLSSNLCEMSFPSIAPCKEEFLIRIAKDNVFLKCSIFNAESQMIGRNILIVLHENRHRYKWEYVYGGGLYLNK